MLLRCLITFVLFSFYYLAYTQVPQADMDKNSLFNKGDEAFTLASRNSDSAIGLARDLLSRAAASRNALAEANAWNALGWASMHQGRLDSAAIYLRMSWQLFWNKKRADDIVRVSINLAEVYTKQSNISEAIQYLMKADSICLRTGNLAFHTNVKRQLGIVYRESGDYEKASAYLNEALDGFARLKNHFLYVGTGISLSILLRKLQLMDSSRNILNRCLAVIKEHTKSDYQAAMVEEHLGETSFDIRHYQEALEHYTNAYKIFQRLNNKADVAFESFAIGKTLVQLNRITDAEKYLLQSYLISDTLKMMNYQFDASSELAALYKKTGDWKNAYQYLQKASELKDSLDLSAQKQQTNELKEKFETEKKEQEIALLKTQNELADATHKRTRLLQYVFIILFAASVVIGWLLLNRFRMKKRLEAQTLRNQIAADLHDDIGSALSSIDISSRIALVRQENTQAMADQLAKIQHHTRKTMDSMSDIVWSINPKNDDFESILMRMREFAFELCEAMKIGLQFNVAAGLEHITLSTDERKNIFLIFKEAINNAVKYSECTKITVDFARPSKEKLVITITDDGKGFDEGTIRKGNGLQNMRARAKHIGGSLSIDTTASAGTTITLHCPTQGRYPKIGVH